MALRRMLGFSDEIDNISQTDYHKVKYDKGVDRKIQCLHL